MKVLLCLYLSFQLVLVMNLIIELIREWKEFENETRELACFMIAYIIFGIIPTVMVLF